MRGADGEEAESSSATLEAEPEDEVLICRWILAASRAEGTE